MSTIDELAARIAALEAERDAEQARARARAQAVEEWLAVPLEERAAQLAADPRAGTTPDGIYYLTDYQQAADTPSYSLALANSVQAGLDRHQDKDVAGIAYSARTAGGGTNNQIGFGWLADPGLIVAAVDNVVGAPLAWSDHTHQYMAQLMPGNGPGAQDGQIVPNVFTFASIGPGEEQQQAITFIPGTYFAATIQHFSTYLHVVVNDAGNGTGHVRVRNSTTATTHTNVKVHLVAFNPPPA